MKTKIMIGVFLSIVIVLTILVTLNVTTSFDESILDFFANNRNEPLNFIMLALTHIGSYYVIIPIMCLVFLIPNFKKHGLILTIATASSLLVNTIMKYIICRVRPEGFFLDTGAYEFPSSFSFPSGHSQNSFMFYVLLCYLLLCRFPKSKKVNLTILTISTIFAVLIGFSRGYIGVHYPTDIMAGISLGIVFVLSAIAISHKFSIQLENNPL